MIFKFVFRNIRAGLLRSLIVVFSFAVSLALVFSVLNVSKQIEQNLVNSSGFYDLVITPQGGRSQAVFSTVYFSEPPIGNMSHTVFDAFERLKEEDDARAVPEYQIDKLIPLALGDSIGGHALVGTVPAYLADYVFLSGKNFDADSSGHGLVLGYSVATIAKLSVGDAVFSAHGLGEDADEQAHERHAYTVTGILQRTGTPADIAAYCAIDNIWEAHTHHETDGTTGAEDEPDENEITAILISASFAGQSRLQILIANGGLNDLLNASDGTDKTYIMANNINAVFREFLENVAFVADILNGVIVVVIVLTVIIIFLAMLSAFSERKKELAIMRVVGFSRGRTVVLFLLEALILSLVGLCAGFLLSKVILTILHFTIAASLGGQVSVFLFTLPELYVALGAPLLALAAAAVPVITVYRFKPVRYLR